MLQNVNKTHQKLQVLETHQFPFNKTRDIKTQLKCEIVWLGFIVHLNAFHARITKSHSISQLLKQ